MAEVTTNSNRTYLSINGNGKLAKKATETTPGAVKSTYNEGTPQERTVWQMEFSSIKGKVTGMFYKTHPEYGESLNVVIDDEYALQLKVGSRWYYSFIKSIEGVDFTKPVKFSPWKKEGADKKVIMILFMSQGDDTKNLPPLYTKEAPNGMPEMVKVTFKGKDQWDDTAMQIFSKNLIEKKVIPRIPGARVNTPAANPATSATGGQQHTPQPQSHADPAATGNGGFPDDGSDDLPF